MIHSMNTHMDEQFMIEFQNEVHRSIFILMANVSCLEGLKGLSFIQATSLFLPLKLYFWTNLIHLTNLVLQ